MGRQQKAVSLLSATLSGIADENLHDLSECLRAVRLDDIQRSNANFGASL
jgi:hypothetical protein